MIEYKAAIRAFKTCLTYMKDESTNGQALGQTMVEKDINKLRRQQLSAYYHIAISYARLEKWERSLWPFTRCIQIDPSDPKYQMERGKVYQALQLFDEAIEDFNSVIKGNPKNAHAFFRRAFAYKATKEFEKAAEDFERARKLDPLNEKLVVSHKHLKNVNYLQVCQPGEEKVYSQLF